MFYNLFLFASCCLLCCLLVCLTVGLVLIVSLVCSSVELWFWLLVLLTWVIRCLITFGFVVAYCCGALYLVLVDCVCILFACFDYFVLVM